MLTYDYGTCTVTVLNTAWERGVYDTYCDLIDAGYATYAAARMAFARYDIAPSVLPDMWAHMTDR